MARRETYATKPNESKRASNHGRVLTSEELSYSDISTAYSLERVVLAFYFSVLRKKPNKWLWASLSTIGMLLLQISNGLIRGEMSLATADVVLFVIEAPMVFYFFGFNVVYLLMGYVELRRKGFYMRGAY